jgi:tripartite-type tricarboxylate transporter receptor subunit TctC
MRHLALTLLFALTSLPANAQTATRPIRIINPYSVGGASDTFSRIIAQKITEQTGKTIVVDNRTGAGGRIGYETGAHSPGDGNTMVLLDATYSMLPGLFANLPWDPAVDLIPTAMIAQTPFVILVKPEARFKILPDLLAEARAHPGKLNFGSSGVGSVNHIVTEFFKSEAHVDITHIPFKGMGDAAVALLGGTVDLIITASPTAMGQISGGKLRPLAVTSAQRSPALPKVPTVAESGVPGYVVTNWFGLAVPKGTPRETINTLHADVIRALGAADVKERLILQGAEASNFTSEEFARFLRDDTRRWTEVIKSAGIKAGE